MELSPLYLGLASCPLSTERIPLFMGLEISKTFAHVMLHSVIAFSPPEKPNRHHPAPWKNVGGWAYDIDAEIKIPDKIEGISLLPNEIAQALLGLIRLSVGPQIISPVISTLPFQKASTSNTFRLLETHPRCFPVYREHQGNWEEKHFGWLQNHGQDALTIIDKHEKIRSALDILSNSQFVMHSGLAMVAIWAALESIFEVTNETVFRISAYIACYLRPHGEGRIELFNKCKKLYQHRCNAAHGGKTTPPDELIQSMNLLCDVLFRTFETRKVPLKRDLNELLFA